MRLLWSMVRVIQIPLKVIKEAVEILYGLSYSIKMSKKSGNQPEGYFDYRFRRWKGCRFEDDYFDGNVIDRKDEFVWIMMIRQPEFVTQEVFETAKEVLSKKNRALIYQGQDLKILQRVYVLR